MRGVNRGTVMAGAILACGAVGVALAQKPPPLGAPGAQEGGKPQAVQPAPAPAPVPPPRQAAPAPQPAPGTDKFGQAQQPPATPPAQQQTDKFGQPPGQAAPATPQPPAQAAPTRPQPPAQAAPATPQPPAQAAPATPPPPRQAAPTTPQPPLAAPAVPPPADELETVRQFRRLLGPETQLSYASADLLDPARGAVRMTQVVLQRPDKRAGIAELTLDGLRENGVTEAILNGVMLQEGAAGRGDEVRIGRVRIAGLSVQVPPAGQQLQPDQMSLDSLRIENLSVQGETPVSIASLSLEDYGRGRAGRMAMEGLEVRTPNQDPIDRVALRRLSLRGIDLAATLAAIVAKQPPPRTTGAAAIEAEDLVLAKGGRQIGGLASMTLSGDAPTSGTGPETGRLAFRGITIQPFPGAEDWMRRFGYSSLVGDLTLDATIDRAGQRVEIGAFSLGVRDMAALGFSMAMDGVNPEETDPAALARGRLVSMRLRYVDQSLYGRFVRMQAQQTRRTEQQVREELATQARALFERPPGAPSGPGGKGGGTGGTGSATVEIGNAVQRFLRGQAREIEISARPPQPVPFERLQSLAPGGPDALQQALGLTVTTR